MISQACATSLACLAAAAAAVTVGMGPQLVVATDRTSNGPQLTYPAPSAAGGAPVTTNWVLDSFARDPWAGSSMLAAAEKVAEEAVISRSELDELTALRSDQYAKALADDRAFQRRYMVEAHIPRRRQPPSVIDADEGVRPAVPDEIAARPPAVRDGRHTFATQTHPRKDELLRVQPHLRPPARPDRTPLGHGLIEELRQRGGGTGLFTGCAAGDTGAAIVLRVED
jgi:acetyl-CoA C-acetyltransferase